MDDHDFTVAEQWVIYFTTELYDIVTIRESGELQVLDLGPGNN